MSRKKQVRILCVEDDHLLARMYVEFLEDAGYAVETAWDGETALAVFDPERHDVILLDYALPKLNGMDVLRELTRHVSPPPVIMVTANGEEKTIVEAMKLGASDFLVKDSRAGFLQLLPVVIERTLEQHRLARERKKLEARIWQRQKFESLGLMAAGVAHDFNNLLTSILGNASLALLDLEPGTAPYSNVKHVEEAARRAADLSTQMLAYSGQRRFLMQTLDLSELIGQIHDLIQTAIPEKIRIEYDLAHPLPHFDGDSNQVQQMLLDILTNSAEAIGESEGVIRVRTGMDTIPCEDLSDAYINDLPPGRCVYVEIGDTGCGMDAETRDRIFDPFFTTKFTGRGLGLAAVLGIVRGHKGAIQVRTDLDKGTTMRVFFSCEKTHAAAPAPRALDASSVADTSAGHHKTVLVVDDDPQVRDVTRVILERYGFIVVTAADGAEGLITFRNSPDAFSLALVNFSMPRMDGRQLFQEIRKLRPGTPVIICSGYSEFEIARRFVEESPTAFVQKPFQAHTLIEKILGALGARK